MTTAKFGWPVAADLSAFDGDNQIAAVYAAVEARLSESVATASALPDESERPQGHLITALDTWVIYQNRASGWVVAFNPSTEAGTKVFGTSDTGGTITSSTFAAIPSGPLSVSITVAVQRLARVVYRFAGTCNAGTMDVGVAVSGATTIAATDMWTGAAHESKQAAYVTVFASAPSGFMLEKVVRLNVGSNTLTAQARIGGAGGTKQLASQFVLVELL